METVNNRINNSDQNEDAVLELFSDKTGRLNQMTSATPSQIIMGPISPYYQNSGVPSVSTKVQAYEQVDEEDAETSIKDQSIILTNMPDFAEK